MFPRELLVVYHKYMILVKRLNILYNIINILKNVSYIITSSSHHKYYVVIKLYLYIVIYYLGKTSVRETWGIFTSVAFFSLRHTSENCILVNATIWIHSLTRRYRLTGADVGISRVKYVYCDSYSCMEMRVSAKLSAPAEGRAADGNTIFRCDSGL